MVFSKKPARLNYQPANVSSYDEINYAAGLLMSLWAKPIQQGPTSKSYDRFLELTFQEKMRRVGSGEFAVMCQGFRDLFLHASSADDHFRVRAIEAYNYAPQIPDLIAYGHSTAEVYVNSLKKWVLFDPWLGIIVTKNGVPIGAAEINQNSDNNALAVVPLMDHLPRMYRTKNGKIIHKTFYPKDVKLNKFSCESLGRSPGFTKYFKTFSVHKYLIE